MFKKITVCIGICVLHAITGVAQNSMDVKALDEYLSELNNTDRFNGAILYAENGEIVYKKAFGFADFRSGEMLNTHSSFNLASVSKQFVAMCIMILEEKGELDYDSDITKYIPEIPYTGITVRNLLTHTSGIPEYFDLYEKFRTPLDTLSNDKMLQLFVVHKPKLDFITGSEWQYCNTNYILLTIIAERLAKQSFPDFFREQIAEPLKLKDTYVYNILMPTIPDNHVIGFENVNGVKKLNDLYHIDGVVGDGNIYSSVEDLFIWEQSMLTAKLVKASTLEEAFTPVKLNNGTTYPYGFGWFIDKENQRYYHTGGWVAFSNIIIRDEKTNRTLIVLTNGSNGSGFKVAADLFEGKSVSIAPTTLITNANVIDGTGTPARVASVRIEGNLIIGVGDLKPFPNEQIIDGSRKVLTPGFIDTHSHVDRELNNNTNALPAISQGITTIVIGQDGDSDPIDSLTLWSKKYPKSVNVASYTGHATLRAMVMGENDVRRAATQIEIDSINEILKSELTKGSLGLSTGLEYEGGFYATRDEIIQLANTTSFSGGKYISHIRSEDINLKAAIDEIILIGYLTKVPVQISHIKIALKDEWGTANDIIATLESARAQGVEITADCYPYTFWNATIRVLFPNKDFTNLEAAQYATTHLFDASGSIMVRYLPNPEYTGKTITEIAKLRNETPEATLLYLVAAAEAYEQLHPEADYVEAIMGKSMTDDDIIPFLTWTHTNICSDGSNGGHPRGYGAFTRVLGNYVREQQIMSLPTAINKMTALSAEHVGIKNRGIIAPGYYADLVLLNPETVKDNADINNSTAVSDGIITVWVNGTIVYENKQATNKFPGVFLTRYKK